MEILSLLGLAKTIPSLNEFYKKIKARIDFPTIHEDILYNCMKTAVQDVTGQDIADFDMNEKNAVYEAALLFFEDPNNNKDRLYKLYYSSNINIEKIQERFITNLIKNGGHEFIISLLTQFSPKLDAVQESVNHIESGVTSILEQFLASKDDNRHLISEVFKKLMASQVIHKGDYFKLDDKFNFYKAPSIPPNFIKRSETISDLKLLIDKQIIFIYGITRTGKSFLISEYLNNEKADYFWYDFKLNEINGDNFLYLLLSQYINSDGFTPSIVSDGGHFNFETISDSLNKKITDLSNYYIILDNIQLSKNIGQLDSFIKILLDKAGAKIHIFLISEEKDIQTSFTSNTQNINEFNNTGFSISEMISLFEINEINTKNVSTNFLEMIYYNSNQGHPDIINGLILEIKNKDVKSLLSAEVVNQVLNSFKNLPAQQKINKILAEKLFSNVLKTDEHKNLFIRLSCLIGLFTKDLAGILAMIEPPITNYHLIFPLLGEKLFDIYPDSKYSIPKVFKDTSDDYLTADLKNKVFIKAADYLSAPKNGILNINDGELACTYFLLAGKFQSTYLLASGLLRRILTDGSEYLQNVLKKFSLYINYSIKDDYVNEQIDLFILAFEGYRRLGDMENQVLVSDILFNTLHSPKLIKSLKHIVSSVLLSFYIIEKNRVSGKIVEVLSYFLEEYDEENFPYYDINKDDFLRGIFLQFLTDDNPVIGDFNKLIILCIDKKLNVEQIFDKSSVIDSHKILWSRLYNLIKLSKDISSSLKNITADLNNLIETYKKISFIIGLREIKYLIGVLITDLGLEPIEAIKYFLDARNENDKLYLDDKEFLARNYLAIADAYYKGKQYDLALDNYLLSVKIFKEYDIEEIIIVHNSIRIGICYFELHNSKLSEKYFWSAYRYARKAKSGSQEMLYLVFGDLSTFYISTSQYVKAIKCFVILNSLLEQEVYSPKHQIISQSLSWLAKIKIDNNPMLEKYSSGDKEFYKPFWGMYNNPKYVDNRATKLNTLFVLAEAYNIFDKCTRALNIYKTIVVDKGETDWDYFAKFLSLAKLVEISIRYDYYEDILFCFEYLLPILNEINRIKISEFHMLETTEINRNLFVNQIANKYVKKYYEKQDFVNAEKLFIKLFAILNKNTSYYFTETLSLELSSIFGWLYRYNIHFDKHNYQISMRHLSQANEKALSLNRIDIYVNNKQIELFLTPVISNLNDYVNTVFDYIFIIKDYLNREDLIEPFIDTFQYFILHITNPAATSEEKMILAHIKNIFLFFTTNISDNMIFLIIGLLKIRFIIGYNKEKVYSTYKYVLSNLKNIHKTEVNNVIENFVSLHNDLLRKNISDDNYSVILNNEFKKTLNQFLNNNKSIIDADCLKILEEKLKS